jgi:tetratricopeptide (TPR) repeat protein
LYHLQKFVRRNRSRIAATGLIGVLGLALAVAVGRQSLERAARRAETASAVSQALDAAERAIGQAKWPDAMAEVRQAEALLGPGGGHDVLRRRSRMLKDDLTMVLRLDEIRLEMSAVKDDHFDTGLTDRLYGEAFRDYGIDVESLEPDAVASKMPGGSVREELVAALDDWMRIRRGTDKKDDQNWKPDVDRRGPATVAREMHKKDDQDWKRLLAAARAADPDPWRNRVREVWERGDRKALSDLTKSAPFDRLHPCDVLLLEANLDTSQAVAVLREAQRRRPGDFWLNHTLGMRLHGMRPPRFDEAIGYLRTASALRPESPGAILNVGHVLEMADRTDEAIAAYEQAIRLKPDYAMAYSNLGGALNDAGRFDEAISACRTAIRLNPNSPAAHGYLGRALTQLGELDEAIAALRESLRLEPGGSLAARHLADACYRKVVAGLLSVHKFIDIHLVRLRSPRPFLQSLLDPRSLPMLRRHFVLKLLAVGVLAAPALAGGKPPRYTLTSFNVPGSTFTRGFAINHAATIVGVFRDPAGVSHGYFWSNGVFTPFDYPNSTGTFCRGINDAGVCVGIYNDALTQHGFVYDGVNVTPTDYPGATSTHNRDINLAGDIVGTYGAAGISHGFLLSGGVWTTIDSPGYTNTICESINANGQIVGHSLDAGPTRSFLLSNGVWKNIAFPKAVSTQVQRINNNGQIVGFYQMADGVHHGFLLSGGTYTSLNYPNAMSTEASGINDVGEIVGLWDDAGGTTHGYYAVEQRGRRSPGTRPGHLHWRPGSRRPLPLARGCPKGG